MSFKTEITEPVVVFVLCEMCRKSYNHTYEALPPRRDPTIEIIDGFCEQCKRELQLPCRGDDFPTMKINTYALFHTDCVMSNCNRPHMEHSSYCWVCHKWRVKTRKL